MCPSPNTTYFSLVSPSSPTGPRACSLSVEMPISAPRPYSKPSAKRVEALTITELESTSVRKRRAVVKFSVMMLSVCCEPCRLIWAMASSRSEEHTSELQSRPHLVCRLLLEKKKMYADGGAESLVAEAIAGRRHAVFL